MERVVLSTEAVERGISLRSVTKGPKYHFFGYYDKRQWDPSGRYLLSYETDFMDRPPTSTDEAVIGMIDLEDGDRFIPLATTRAWCWQQGAMLQWVPGSTSEIIFNDRIADRFVSIILDVHTGRRRTLPRPIYTVSNDGQWALSVNFSRLQTTRPGYGYPGLHDHWADDPHPAQDGIYRMELATGNHELIVDLASLAAFEPNETMDEATHWFNHLLYSPDDRRFIFLHRWSQDGVRRQTRMFTVGADGSDLRMMQIYGASHFIWYDGGTVLVWAQTAEHGAHYYLCADATGEAQTFAQGILTRDGHCTRSPNGRWVLTDEYPNKEGFRPLILYHIEDEKRIDVAHLLSPPEVTGEIRCDLHPRWSPDGRFICIDSVHEGSRQMYVVDVSALMVQG